MCVQVLLAHLPNIESTCWAFVSSPLLHAALCIWLECTAFCVHNFYFLGLPSLYLYLLYFVFWTVCSRFCHCLCLHLFFFNPFVYVFCISQIVQVKFLWNRPKSAHTHIYTPTDCPLLKAPTTHLSYCPIQIQSGALPEWADQLTPLSQWNLRNEL